jgi:Cu-Zn family superoxide dismutase
MTTIRTLGLCLCAATALSACDQPDKPLEPTAQPPATRAAEPVGQPSAAPASQPGAAMNNASSLSVILDPASGSQVSGEVKVSASTGGLQFDGRIVGLAPDSTHGFHVHTVGDCSAPDASSAGEHFNPTDTDHGDPTSDAHHLGDLPNLQADAEGQASVDLRIDALELGTGSQADILGRALVVHAQPDNFTEQPSGGSGERIACGVVRRPTAP